MHSKLFGVLTSILHLLALGLWSSWCMYKGFLEISLHLALGLWNCWYMFKGFSGYFSSTKTLSRICNTSNSFNTCDQIWDKYDELVLKPSLFVCLLPPLNKFWGKEIFSEVYASHSVQGGMQGRGGAWQRGHAWLGVACVVGGVLAGGMHGRVCVCVARGMHGRVCVCGPGHAWQEACMVGSMHGRGHACRTNDHWIRQYAYYWTAFLFVTMSAC